MLIQKCLLWKLLFKFKCNLNVEGPFPAIKIFLPAITLYVLSRFMLLVVITPGRVHPSTGMGLSKAPVATTILLV